MSDSSPARGSRILLERLACMMRNTSRKRGAGPDAPGLRIVTGLDQARQLGLELLQAITVQPEPQHPGLASGSD